EQDPAPSRFSTGGLTSTPAAIADEIMEQEHYSNDPNTVNGSHNSDTVNGNKKRRRADENEDQEEAPHKRHRIRRQRR
ncbi:MAG: hypothetical protein Q9224_007076, partial [Gallowayella concinna]